MVVAGPTSAPVFILAGLLILAEGTMSRPKGLNDVNNALAP